MDFFFFKGLFLLKRKRFNWFWENNKTRVAGIEPTHAALKAAVLPLNYTPFTDHQDYRTCTFFGHCFNNIIWSFSTELWAYRISLTATFPFSVDF